MTPERWDRIKELFGGAMDLDPADRAVFLDRSAGSEPELRAEVEALLQRHDASGALLDRELPRPAFHSPLLASVGMSLKDGEVVNGRFRIVRLVGQGGMGEVYEAEDLELHTRIAIKTVRTEVAAEEAMRERFRQEILLARSVTHPNVCRLFDVGTYQRRGEPAILFLTMEYLEGETLSGRLARSGRCAPADALPLARQMAAALDAAHAAGVVHRDFKAANVMLVASAGGDRAVVTDFGLARGLSGKAGGESVITQSDVAVGTPAYMAPEQIEGKAAGPAADVYAFGVVLYEMVAGRRPYSESSPLAMAVRKMREPPPSPGRFASGIDKRLQSAILQCLALDPADRFASAGDAVCAMESGRGLSWRRVRLRRLRLWPAAVLAILAAGACWVRFWRELPPIPLTGDTARWYAQGVDALHAGASWRASRLLERVTSAAPGHVPSHARLAEAYAELDMGDRAKDEILKAGEFAPDRSRLPAEVRLELEASQAIVLRQFDRAAARYGELSNRETGDRKTGTLLDLGRSLERGNRTDAAIGAYEKASALDRQNAAAHLRLAVLRARLRQFKEAVPLFDAAEAGYRLTGDFEGAAEVLLQKSTAFRNARKLAESRAYTTQALDLATAAGNLAQQIRAHFELAAIDIGEGHADVSAREAAASLELARSQGLENLSAAGLNDLGNAYLTQYLSKEAEELFRQALETAKRTGSRAAEARASFSIGSALQRLGDAGSALPFIEAALNFYRQGGYRNELSLGLTLLTDAQIGQGHYTAAGAAASELLSAVEAGKDPVQAAMARERQADILTWQGGYPQAAEIYWQAAESYRPLGQTMRGLYAQANRADLLWRLGRFPEVRALLDEVERGLAPLGEGGRPMAIRLALIRGDQALAERDFAAAVRFAVQAQGGDTGNSYRVLQARRIAGLAQAVSSRSAAGRQACDQVLAAAKQESSAGFRGEAGIAAAGAALAVGSLGEAGRIAREVLVECEQLGEEEMAYRAALLAACAARRAGDAESRRQAENSAAIHALALEALWGKDALATYHTRPDVIALRKDQ